MFLWEVRSSGNSEAFASEFQEDLKDMFPVHPSLLYIRSMIVVLMINGNVNSVPAVRYFFSMQLSAVCYSGERR